MKQMSDKELAELVKQFPTGNAPLAIRGQLVEYQKKEKNKIKQKEKEVREKKRAEKKEKIKLLREKEKKRQLEIKKENNKKTKYIPKKNISVNDNGQIVLTSKTDQFLEEFLRNGGNATQAALAVFNCSTLDSAANIGSKYLKKSKELARVYMERSGLGYGKLLDVAVEKMIISDKPEWWDRLMKMAGYEDFLSTNKKTGAGVSVNVFQAHKAVSSEYIDGEIVDEPDLVGESTDEN